MTTVAATKVGKVLLLEIYRNETMDQCTKPYKRLIIEIKGDNFCRMKSGKITNFTMLQKIFGILGAPILFSQTVTSMIFFLIYGVRMLYLDIKCELKNVYLFYMDAF